MPCHVLRLDEVRPAYTYPQTAQLLGVTRYRVARMVQLGVLDTVRIGAYPGVTRASIRKFLQSALADETPPEAA